MSRDEIRYDFPGVERLPVILRLAADRMEAELPRGGGIADFRVGIDVPAHVKRWTADYQGGSGYVIFRHVKLPGGKEDTK